MSDKINWHMSNNINFRLSKSASTRIPPPPAQKPLSRVQKNKNMDIKPVSYIPMSHYAPPMPSQKPRVIKEGEQPAPYDRYGGIVCQAALKGFEDKNTIKFSPYSFWIGVAVAFLIIGIAAIIYPPCT